MQARRILICYITCCFVVLGSAHAATAVDSFRLRFGNEKLVQVGLSYRHAVRFELQAPTVELLVQPIKFFSLGYRIGKVSTNKLPELFEGSRGELQGFILRWNHPIKEKLDLYAEYAKTNGDLGFSAAIYGDSTDPRYSTITSISGEVSFRQNHFQLGLRQHLGRYFFVDGSIGIVAERFILRSEGLTFNDIVNEDFPSLFASTFYLPPNAWHKNKDFRVGLSVGLRF